MCVNDIRLARWITTRTQTATITGGTQVTIPRSSQRVGVLLALDAPSATLSTGVVWRAGLVTIGWTNAASGPSLMTLLDYGRLIQEELRTLTLPLIGNQLVSITEFFLPEKVLQAYIQQFERDFPGLT